MDVPGVRGHDRLTRTDELTDTIIGLADPESAVALARNPRAPVAVRWRLAGHGNPAVPETAAGPLALHGRDLLMSLVAQLLDDPELEIRRAAARHPNVPLKRLPSLLTGAAPAMPATWFPPPGPVRPLTRPPP